jgi:enoyl-CoA hydratase
MSLTVTSQGHLGHLQLNRPKALNSLTIDMVRALTAALDEFEADPAIEAVLLDGAGERGLCAGGDIRALYQSAKAQDGAAEQFLREEYALNARIAAYSKPYIAIMDGITMGGGVGVSAHGAHRVVTERTRLAMPETGIGFFPDVGGTWLLSRAPGEIGTYIGLTGTTITGADAIYAGLANYHIPSSELPALIDALATQDPAATLQAAHQPAEAPLATVRAVIDTCLAFDTMAEIFAALAADGSAFAQETAAILAKQSPTSLVLTLRLLRLARQSTSLQTCLDREYTTATHALHAPDFFEGVRAAVIDKDRNPAWSPALLADVVTSKILEWTAL